VVLILPCHDPARLANAPHALNFLLREPLKIAYHASMEHLTPREIVEALDRHIVGQAAAKRAVAVAIRNRWRRRQLGPDMAGEVYPKNIIMVGPTGVGKTEIARRLAGLVQAPFIKIEASKFTEVGYHGRDVESMIRDLLDQAMNMVRQEKAQTVREKAEQAANERLIDLLLPGQRDPEQDNAALRGGYVSSSGFVGTSESHEQRDRIRRKLRAELEAGTLDEREVEVQQRRKPAASMVLANMGMDQMDPDLAGMLERMMPQEQQRRLVTVAEARRILTEEETDKLLDRDDLAAQAIERTEHDGIIFLDEIDKIASPAGKGSSGGGGSPDVSRQGVQRDLLPIVEGSSVSTRHGVVRTDHILFVAAGAFHVASVSDLMPELQGRFPIRVELSALTREDFRRILTEPSGALTRQQEALLAVEGLHIAFEDAAIDAIADLAAQANAALENIGARRLVTIMDKILDQINFDAPERVAAGETSFTVTDTFVREQVESILQDKDLSRFVL